MELNNRVVRMKPRKSVWDRVARSALVLCSNEEWLEVIAEAQDRGIIRARHVHARHRGL